MSTIRGDLFPSEDPNFLRDGGYLFGEVGEIKPSIPPQILPSAPVLQEAIDELFIEGNVFDKYANAHNLKYCMMVTVDVEVNNGQVKTVDLKKFGLKYPGEVVSVTDLGRDRILPRQLGSEADWKILPGFSNTPSILVRLNPDSLKNSKEHLMARLAYGLYKFMWRETLQSTPNTDWQRVGLAREKRDFKEAIERTLSQHGVHVVPEYDPEPRATPTDEFIRAYITYERNPESTSLQEIVEWGLANPDLPGVKSAIAFVKRLGVF